MLQKLWLERPCKWVTVEKHDNQNPSRPLSIADLIIIDSGSLLGGTGRMGALTEP